MMKALPVFLMAAAGIVSVIVACRSQTVSTLFDGEKIIFPITIKDAVKRSRLSYNPPGYFFRRTAGRELSIRIEYNPRDYDNEYQPQEVLHDRNVVSYVFSYDGTTVKSEDVKQQVEEVCRCKLSWMADSLSADRDAGYQPGMKSLLPQQGRHLYAIAPVSPDLTIGFRNKPNYKGLTIPEVRIFYKQNSAQIRKAMMEY